MYTLTCTSDQVWDSNGQTFLSLPIATGLVGLQLISDLVLQRLHHIAVDKQGPTLKQVMLTGVI